MKSFYKLKLFLLTMLLALIGSGDVWAESYTYNFSSGGVSSGSGTATVNTWTTDYFTIVQEKNNSTSNVSASYLTSPRWYASHTVTFTPASNIKITRIVINCGGTNNGQTITASTGSVSVSGNNSTWTGEITLSSPLVLTMGKQCRPTNVVVTYESTGSSSSKTNYNGTWSVSSNSVIVQEGSTTTVTVDKGTFDGTVGVISDDTSVATATYSNNTITVTGVSEGTTTLTVTGTESSTYNELTPKTVDVTVTAATGGTRWELTDLASLTASDVFVIVDQTSSRAMTNDNGTGSAPAAEEVTLTQDKSRITGTVADNLKWNLSGNASDGYVFYPNGDTSTWLYATNANNGVRVGTNANKTFTLSTNWLLNSATTRYLGVYSSQDWRCYTSTTGNISGTVTKFYKRISTGPEDPTFSFKSTTPSITWNAVTDGTASMTYSSSTNLNTNSGGTVTYTLKSTSPSGCATMDADGTLTITQPGTITVSAIIAADGTSYNAVTEPISYTLTVNKAANTATFASATPSAYLTAGTYQNTLSNNNAGAVTYSISATPAGCATINATTGEVSLLATGTATVTATIAATDYVLGAAPTYTLTIEAAPKTPTSLAFAEPLTYEVTKGTQTYTDGMTKAVTTTPAALTGIVYTSSNTDVATVNASTGALSFGKAGTATITASYAGDASYEAATPVSYSVTVLMSVGAPTFSVPAGSYESDQNVTITATGAAKLVYTTDGTEPTLTNGTVVNAASTVVAVTSTTTLKATAFDADNDQTAVATATYAIVAAATEDTYVLVTDASDLEAGKSYVILGSGTAYSMSTTQNTNNRAAVEVASQDTDNNRVEIAATTQVFTLRGDATNGWSFDTGSGYLYAAGSDKNYLRTQEKLDYNGKADISFSGNDASVVFRGTNRNVLQFNDGKDNKLFSCYSSASQTAVQLYKKAITTLPAAPIAFTPTTATLTIGDAFTPPTLTNEEDLSVTYSTSDATILDVNATTGVMTYGDKAGTATITASYAGGETYRATDATFTLTVNRKAASVSWDGGQLGGSTALTAGTYNLAATSTSGAAITYAGNNDAVATVNATTGVVTLVAAGVVSFTATAAETAEYASATSRTFTLVVTDGTEEKYELVTSADEIVAGEQYLIVGKNATAGSWHAASSAETNYRLTTTVAVDANNVIAYPALNVDGAPYVFTLETGASAGTYYLADASGNYLSKDGENLKTGATKSEFTVALNASGYADIKSADVSVLFNATDPRIKFYSSAQSHLYLFKRKDGPVFTYPTGTYNGDLSVGIAAPRGATIYYTLTQDGTEPAYPTTSSSIFSSNLAFAPTRTVTIKAVYELNGAMSNMTRVCYTLQPEASGAWLKEETAIDESAEYLITNLEGTKAAGLLETSSNRLYAYAVDFTSNVDINATGQPYTYIFEKVNNNSTSVNNAAKDVSGGQYYIKVKDTDEYLYCTSASDPGLGITATAPDAGSLNQYLWAVEFQTGTDAGKVEIWNVANSSRLLTYFRQNSTNNWFRDYVKGTNNTEDFVSLYKPNPSTGNTLELTTTVYEGYTTFYDATNNYRLPEGVTGYLVRVSDGNLTEEPYYGVGKTGGEIIPAGTAVLLQGTAATQYTLTAVEEADLGVGETMPTTPAYSLNNLLGLSTQGTTAAPAGESAADYRFYKFTTRGGQDVGWYYGAADGVAFTLPAGKAYLAVKKATAAAAPQAAMPMADATMAKGTDVTIVGYASLYSDMPLVVPAGVSAAAVYVENGNIYFDYCYAEGDVIPAETGVVLRAEPAVYEFLYTDEDGTAPRRNNLRGTVQRALTEGEGLFYKMALENENDVLSVGFYFGAPDGGAFYNEAGKTYLLVPFSESLNAVRGYSFAEAQNTTAISTPATTNLPTTPAYDLQGRRTRAGGKGIYIVNGKKVIM